MSIEADIQSLSPSAIIDLFELDATSLGDSIYRWTNEVNELGNDVVWDGNTYTRFPIEATGFEKQGSGKQPRPILRCANTSGLIGDLAATLDGLVGAKVTRRRTFIKYLDAVNFAAGNAQADPLVAFAEQVFYVDRKSNENGLFIEFELSSALDLTGVMLPRRQVIQNVCTWTYRSAECGFTGGAIADINDNVVTDINLDRCGKRVASCGMRFGVNNELPYGGFPGAGKT